MLLMRIPLIARVDLSAVGRVRMQWLQLKWEEKETPWLQEKMWWVLFVLGRNTCTMLLTCLRTQSSGQVPRWKEDAL